MDTSSSSTPPLGHVVVRLDVIALEQHEPHQIDASTFSGAAGILLMTGPDVEGLKAGDVVMLCTESIENPLSQKDALLTLPRDMVCKVPSNVPCADAARLVSYFLGAVAILDASERVPLAFVPGKDSNSVPTSILILASESPIDLITTRLLRNAIPDSKIFVLYDFEPAASDAEFDIIKPMIHGATYTSKPDETQDAASVLEAYRNATREYDGRNCVDLLLDLNGRDEWFAHMRQMLCEDGVAVRKHVALQADLNDVLETPAIMEELSRLVRIGDLQPSELNVRSSA